MPKHHQQTERTIFSILLYAGGFLLFWEWLRPLGVISDTGNVTAFILFAGFCFLLSVLGLSKWITVPLKLIAAVFILDGLFMNTTIGTPSWFQAFSMEIQYNIGLIENRVWTAFTPFFRTMLFLVLLWLMSYLLYYWFVIVKRVFLFVLLTFIYLTILDTFTAYQANGAIVRTFIISMFVLAISNFLNLMSRESIRPAFGRWFVSSIIPILLLLPVITGLGFLAPKFDPKWPDPVPFLTSTANQAGFGEGGKAVTQKVGYGEDDTQLGGSFIQDDTTVFIAESPQRHYWRIESKDEYTGKGWERSSDLDYQLQEDGQIDLDMYDPGVETQMLDASIAYTDEANFTKLVYPYGVDRFTSSASLDYMLDQETGTIEVEGGEQEGVFNEYRVQYGYPSFNLTELEQQNPEDPASIRDRYLQLPNSLPNRVVELAGDITREETNRYDQAKAIERYFGASGFTYQTEDVAIPGRGEDYVDQFLFDTQVGYCDNFSTSMVVLLRAIDIPARWVKGFSGGQLATSQVVTSGNEQNTYEITNGNAHSWVEVYFPDIGWVPFEPTIGFTNNVDFYQETSGDSADAGADEETTSEEEEQEQSEQPEQEEEQQSTDQQTTSDQEAASDLSWYWIVSIMAVWIGITMLLYLFRYRWLTRWMLYRYPAFDNVKGFERSYHYLLRVLTHHGIAREPGQTLREYAEKVDGKLETDQMKQLTAIYEKILYRNDKDFIDAKKAHKLWEDMLKRRLS